MSPGAPGPAPIRYTTLRAGANGTAAVYRRPVRGRSCSGAGGIRGTGWPWISSMPVEDFSCPERKQICRSAPADPCGIGACATGVAVYGAAAVGRDHGGDDLDVGLARC